MKRYIAFAFNREFDQVKGGWGDVVVYADIGDVVSFNESGKCEEAAENYAEKQGYDSIQIVDLETGKIVKAMVKGWVEVCPPQ